MIESREVGDMSSSIHSQKILKDAKVFVFFEDKVFGRFYIGEVVQKLISELMKILSVSEVKLPGTTSSMTLNVEQMTRLVEFIELQAKQERDGFTHNPVNKTLQYIKICLGTALYKGKNLFSVGYELTFEIAIKDFFDNGGSKYIKSENDSNYVKNDSSQIAVWCLDSDGLQLDEKSLNAGRSVSVTPLQMFIHYQNRKGLFKNRKKLLTDLSFHHPQSRRNKIKFDTYESIERTSTKYKYKGTDNFIIMLSPFAEIFRYSINEESLIELEDSLGRSYPGGEGEPVHGIEAFVGRSYLTGGKKIPSLIIRPDQFQEVRSLFVTHEAFTKHWTERDVSQFLNLVKPVKEHEDMGLGGPYIAAGLYLKKGKVLIEGIPVTKFPMPMSQNLPHLNLNKNIAIYKYSALMKPTYKISKSGEKELSGMDRIMVWSDHRRCNGKTLIPLHPDHVSKEILERYGTDVYGGFKPCQRYVKKNLRCPHHM